MENKKVPILITFKVQSKSNPEQKHSVNVFADGFLQCDCIAYEMRKVKVCRHQRIVIDKLKALMKKITESYPEG